MVFIVTLFFIPQKDNYDFYTQYSKTMQKSPELEIKSAAQMQHKNRARDAEKQSKADATPCSTVLSHCLT